MKNLKGEKSNCVITYCPHGINDKIFKPVNVEDEFRQSLFGQKNYKFVLFWMNRNIKRKQPSDVIWAYKKFVDSIPTENRKEVCLIMHTNPIDTNGTDLVAVKKKICPDYEVIFSTNRIDQSQLNKLYNISDVTINIAGNEGFGLTTAESLMAGTPIIVNVTGGLQDQCGFRVGGKELTTEDYIKIGSLHEYKKWEDTVTHGKWVKPVWPRVQTMVGSVSTPYIIDDKVNVDDVTDAIKYWYDMTKMERTECGTSGREWMNKKNGLNLKTMCDTMTNGIEAALKNFKPKPRYNLYKI